MEDTKHELMTSHRTAELIATYEELHRVPEAEREDFAALLDARVETIRDGGFGLETVISGVEPQELKRFGEAYAAHEQAEKEMWMM